MSYVADRRSSVSSKTQRHNLGEDRGVQLWPDLGNRGAHMTYVVNDARDYWTRSVLVYDHVFRVRTRRGVHANGKGKVSKATSGLLCLRWPAFTV